MIKNGDLSLYYRVFDEIRAKVMTNWSKGKKTAIFFAYQGHGSCLFLTSAILNVNETFEVEQNLRDISKMPGVFVLAVLDCDRSL